LRACKIENEATMMFQSERINALRTESEQRQAQVQDLEKRLIESHTSIEQRNIQLREIENKYN
jgi:uncharacterized protein involved in exopolysaccharide biosynthesis